MTGFRKHPTPHQPMNPPNSNHRLSRRMLKTGSHLSALCASRLFLFTAPILGSMFVTLLPRSGYTADPNTGNMSMRTSIHTSAHSKIATLPTAFLNPDINGSITRRRRTEDGGSASRAATNRSTLNCLLKPIYGNRMPTFPAEPICRR